MKRDYKNMGPLRIFMSFYKPHLHLFILDMVCATVATLTDLAFPYATKLSMEKLLPSGMFRAFFTVMAIFVLAYIVKAILYFIITFWGHEMGVRIEADIREDIFAHIQTLSFSFFDHNRTGSLMSRVTTDLFEITELSHHGPEDLFMSGITLIGAFVILCTIRWELALILFATIPIFVLFTIRQRRRMTAANVSVKRKTAEINTAIESGISGARVAKAFANEEVEAQKFVTSNKAFKRSRSELYKTMAIFHSGMEFTMAIMQVVVITAGGYFIMKGRMTYIELFTFSLYVTTFVNPIRKLSAFVEQYMQGMAGFNRFLEIMRTEPEIVDARDAAELENPRGAVEYTDVSFAYAGGATVLSGVNLRIEAGESLAVVGPSGGGKTTLCHLLPRFYDVTGGSVSVDGRDVRSVTQKSLHQNIGIIQQDVFIFAGTIMENIRYGRPDATDQEVCRAAMKAQIHNEIMDMPEGYNTSVGERGVTLSGGQKQRISIARVFLKNPPILILDEATSALDSVTEEKIQRALSELSEGRTSIIIAHRLATIRGADRIAVVMGEGIAEYGTHEELIALSGIYAELYRSQQLTYEAENQTTGGQN